MYTLGRSYSSGKHYCEDHLQRAHEDVYDYRFPEVICTDKGTNFTALLTKEFLKVIGSAPRFANPGHPESMGTVERWNKTLKEICSTKIFKIMEGIGTCIYPICCSHIERYLTAQQAFRHFNWPMDGCQEDR
ncbi:hypothetical protein AVEN_15937-1 [Araneus ventricosus]|uniref:Integrase catalytic domain-containing protein n=1 Tax=Araneus ventricosus TaxID=182803 RepID=A0A4Y2PG35_ARAVE|nr:hypothetical protein AVEN_15937-1 [Araneus ventricosus]